MNDFRCDACGRFVRYVDLDEGKAVHRMLTPDSAYTYEEWETLCPRCVTGETVDVSSDREGEA